MTLYKLIPTPKDYITDKEFIKEYRECFEESTEFISASFYKLKEDYRFEGWHKILATGYINFQDYDGELLTAFRAIGTDEDDDVKYYLNHYIAKVKDYGNFDLSVFAEMDFKGYRRMEEEEVLLISVSKDRLIFQYLTTFKGVNLILI